MRTSGAERVKAGLREFTRGEFIGMGLSAAMLSAAAPPFAAKARTVGFGAATTGKLSDYCRGDGSDETAAINHCFADHLIVEVDEPPAGVGYGFRATRYGGVLLRSGHEVNGRGAAAKFLRVGEWVKNCRGLQNDDHINGNSGIKLNNIYLEGFRHRWDVPETDSDASSSGITIRANDPDRLCRDIQLTRVQVRDWPGISIRLLNGSNLTYRDVKSVNPSRGGVIFNTSRDIDLLRVTSADSGDDAMAFYVTGEPKNRPISGITVDRCETYTRKNPQYGAALKLAGASDALIINSTFRNAKNSLVSIVSYPGFIPRNIRIKDCRMTGGMKHSLDIKACGAKGISIRDNHMSDPKADCVNVITWDGGPGSLDATISGNTLARPGSSRHIQVQKNVKGVKTSGNRLIHKKKRRRPRSS